MDAPKIFATVLSVSSFGAAFAALMGYTQIPADIFGKPTHTANTLVAMQCFQIAVVLASSVSNNYARSHLKFHGLGLIPLIVMSYSCGFTSNVIQNGIVFAICLYLGYFYENGEKDQSAALKYNMPTILGAINVAVGLMWFGAPFMFGVADILPGVPDGQLNNLSLRLATSMSFAYTLPFLVAVANNRAEQVLPFWAVGCLFAVAADLYNTDADNSGVALNAILFVANAGCAFASRSKARTD